MDESIEPPTRKAHAPWWIRLGFSLFQFFCLAMMLVAFAAAVYRGGKWVWNLIA